MINLKDLLKAGVHFGHKTSRWSPKMNPFIWGSKNKIHLINIAKTGFLLERSGKFLKNVASQGKCILFIGTKKAAQKPILEITTRLNSPYVTNRWIGGTLTNFDQVKKAITRLLHLRDVVKKPTEHYKKKELSMIQKEIGRLEKNIGGILKLTYPPGAIIVVDAKKERSAIREAINANIPIISMVDTNTDPANINFVIPANDDSPRSITFILEYLATMVEAGQKIYKDKKKEIETQKELAAKARSAAKITIKKDEKKPTPVKTVEKKAVPVKAVPVKAAPVKAVPVKAVPVKAAPVKAVPVKAAPVKAAPVKAAPVKEVVQTTKTEDVKAKSVKTIEKKEVKADAKKSTEEVKTKTTKKIVATKKSSTKSSAAKKSTTKKIVAKKIAKK